jgi:hypothetical protein
MNDGKRIKLSRKLLIGLFVFAVILFLFTSVFVGVYYYSTRMAEYSDTAYSYARAASRFIDGDRVPGYLEPVGTDGDGEPIYEKDGVLRYRHGVSDSGADGIPADEILLCIHPV